MPLLRSSRLDSILGAPFDRLTATEIEQLVGNSVPEAFDLDYKSELYGTNDQAKRDLAGDVCALANTAGGVIIIGVEDDAQARAQAAPGVPLSDAESRRMRQIIGSGTAPMPEFEIHPVLKSPSNQGLGFYVIEVPPSPAAPHGVLINSGYRDPRRNGAATRYLSEPEVAEAYRARFAGAQQRLRRLDDVLSEVEYRTANQNAWLFVGLVPEIAGYARIDQAAFRAFEVELRRRPSLIVHGDQFIRARVGRGKLVADCGAPSGQTPAGHLSDWSKLELHSDGAGAFGARLNDIRSGPSPSEESARPLISEEALVFAIVAGRVWVGQHGQVRASAAGTVNVAARLVAAIPPGACEIGSVRSGFPTPSGSMFVTSAGGDSTASLDDVATFGPRLLQVAAALSVEIGQWFGLPELAQISPEGELRRRYWNSTYMRFLQPWAARPGSR